MDFDEFRGRVEQIEKLASSGDDRSLLSVLAALAAAEKDASSSGVGIVSATAMGAASGIVRRSATQLATTIAEASQGSPAGLTD